MKKVLSVLLAVVCIAVASPAPATSMAALMDEPIGDALLYAEDQGILACFEPRKHIGAKTANREIRWNVPLSLAEASCAILAHAGVDRKTAAEKAEFVEMDTTSVDSYHVPYLKEASRRGLLPAGLEPISALRRYEALKMLLDIEGVPVLRVVRDEDRTYMFKDIKKDTEIEYIMMTSINRDLVRPVSASISGAKKIMSRGEYVNALYYSSLVAHADFSFQKPDPYENMGENMMPYIEIFAEPVGSIPKYDVFLTIWDILQNNHLYSDRFDAEKAMDLVLEALPNVLDDPYTQFMNADENDSFQDSIRGDFEGIGAYISEEKGEIVIVSPIKKTPAEKAGLQAGDVVLEINGESTEGLSLQEAVRRIKGPGGTTVTLIIKRGSQELSIPIVRARVEVPSVEFELRKDGVMYINIFQFSDKTESEFKKAIDTALSRYVSALVIDLRNNPGGLLSSVEDVTGHFVGKGKPIVQVEYRNVMQELLSAGDGVLSQYPIAVLINKGSASASEILAGALQDYGVATIIGVTSFGKGTVQEVLPFFDGSSFRYTVARWLTPKGKSIDKNGIVPDIEAEDFADTSYIDEAYEKAVDQLLFMNRIPGMY